MFLKTYAIFSCRSSLQYYFFKSYLKPMTKHWLETSRPSSTALGPIHTNPVIFWNRIFFWHELAFCAHETSESVHRNHLLFVENVRQTGLCHHVHMNPRKKRCGFKNVRIRVNVASVTANRQKHFTNLWSV